MRILRARVCVSVLNNLELPGFFTCSHYRARVCVFVCACLLKRACILRVSVPFSLCLCVCMCACVCLRTSQPRKQKAQHTQNQTDGRLDTYVDDDGVGDAVRVGEQQPLLHVIGPVCVRVRVRVCVCVLSDRPFVYLSMSLALSVSVRSSVCPSVCLSVSPA